MKMKLTKTLLAVTIACAGLVIAGCGCNTGPSGKYQDSTGAVTIEFNSGGKVTLSIMGMPAQGTYTVSGNKVTIIGPDQQPLVLTMNSDGTLSGPPESPLGKLTKTK